MAHSTEAQRTVSLSGAPDAKRNFILQQGLDEPPPASCGPRYSALQFQPRILGPVFAAGTLAGSSGLFLAAGVVLWWCALLPGLNPFDALYNRFLARGLFLHPAPGPRRFAQGLAGTISAAIALALATGWHGVALGLEIFLLTAVAAVVFGSFCPGSFMFHLLAGRTRFAVSTLPWSTGGLR